MKFTSLKIAAAIALVPTIASAGVTITPQVAYQTFDNIAKNAAVPQVGLGYRFDDMPFAVELVVGGTTTELVRSRGNRFASPDLNRTAKKKTDVLEYRVDGKYFLPKLTAMPLELYGAAGIGQIMLDGAEIGSVERAQDGKGDYLTMNIGGGAQYAINENLKGVFDARYLNWSMNKGEAKNNVDDAQIALGLQYDFGGKTVAPVTPAPQPVRRDTDGDGVFDDMDKCPNTPRGYAVDASGCHKQLTKTVSIPLRVLFDTNKAVVKPAYNAEIAKVGNFMKEYPASTTVVEGHTDSRGSAKYNQKLSQRRANAVKAAIIRNHGINPARIRAVGYGEAKPVASNATKAGRAQNRRVVAVVNGQKTVIQKR